MIKQFLAICIICSGYCFSQERYITDEEFKEKITWLLPNEENLGLKKVLLSLLKKHHHLENHLSVLTIKI